MDTFPWNDPDADDDLCHTQNLARRQALEEKFRTTFTVQLPPPHETIEQWQQRLESFEDDLDYAARVPIRAFLNHPAIVPLAELTDDDAMAEELDALLDLLALHRLYVDWLTEVPDRELYRYIVEELLEKETAMLVMPFMNTHFVYEESHPNAEYDSKMWAEHFLYSLLDGDEMGICTLLARDAFISSRGEPIPLPVLLVQLRHFWASYTSIYDVQVQALTSSVEGEHAVVEATLAWTGLPYRAAEPVRVIGRARLALKLAEDGFWDVTQATVPGVLESIAPGVVSFCQQER